MKWLPLLNSVKRYLLCYLIAIGAAVALLLLVACLPQAPIDQSIGESAEFLAVEGCYPRIGDRHSGGQLDNYTDAIMLMESRMLSSSAIESVFTNPWYRVEDTVFALSTLPDGPGEPLSYYVRYWMGFRVPLRLSLTFINYPQMRRYLPILLFVLAALTIWSIARHAGAYTAFAFAVSLILVKPQTICNSLQFSCCFLLAMPAMLLLPRIPSKWLGLFFFSLGIATMYFDFYTTPLVTFGLPAVYLFCLQAREPELDSHPLRLMGKLAALWLLGYVFMWFGKLALTTLFTPVNGFADGLSSLSNRIGITKSPEWIEQYSILRAFQAVKDVLIPDGTGALIAFAGALAGVGALICLLRRKLLQPALLRRNLVLPALALLPLIWFAVAAQPTAIHAWFQYRSLAVTFFAIGAYLATAYSAKEKRSV